MTRHVGPAAQPRRARVRDERRRLRRAATRVAPQVGAADAHAVRDEKIPRATCSPSASWYANTDGFGRLATHRSTGVASLGVIFLTVLLDLLGFGIVIPILPLYAEKLHATDFETGILLAIYSVMQLFFSPIWGRLSDRAGRRPVLLISILGSCGSQLGYALAPSFWWLVVARGFAGVCGANITAAQAYIADVTDEKSRAAGMGMLGAAMGLGFVFGPAVGGFLSTRSAEPAVLRRRRARRRQLHLRASSSSRSRAPPAERTRARTLTWAGLVRTATTPRLASLMLLFFVITFGFANLEATFSLFLERRFHYGRREASYMFTYIGVLMVIVQGGMVRRLVPRFGEQKLIIIGTLLMGVGFFMTGVRLRRCRGCWSPSPSPPSATGSTRRRCRR